jgi:NADP-dependent 3-hydroxy acid dehydrogenase YdfG
VDTLLHIAGVVDLGPVGELTPKTWRHQLNVNLIAPAELTRHFLPQLRVTGGHVIFVNSGAGLRASADWSAYAASKHGLKALADSLRHEEHATASASPRSTPAAPPAPCRPRSTSRRARSTTPKWIDPESVATTILMALDLPGDAEINDMTVRPGR